MPSHSDDGPRLHDAAAASEHLPDDRAPGERVLDEHAAGEYVVVARRYRPKTFGELVGQQQVSQALSNAISTNRVGHAYLFTGARGVGKTSTARIFAKCLNCEEGPTPTPCGHCDACLSIAAGDDVDVLEIDGASNRRIEEIRQLRSNVNIRPSRSRFKIYIIDEVHMLTTEAFNALLKTLEEPPEHVKFIFCTTNPEKIPITVLSRCQQFDFPPVPTDSIIERLRAIVQTEGVQADDEALRLLARRAAGSMRDSQSLLEQLLSFSGPRITENDVHAMLGTAQGGRLQAIVEHLIARDAAQSLQQLDVAVREGVDIGQLAEQLLGYLRDVAAALVGCPADLMLHVSTADFSGVREAGQRWGLETTLAALQILDQALTRMKQTTQVRTLVEIALVRICKLEDLDALPGLIAQLRGGGSPVAGPPVARVRREAPSVAEVRVPAAADAVPAAKAGTVPATAAAEATGVAKPAGGLTVQLLEPAWRAALAEISGLKAELAGGYTSLSVTPPNLLVITLRSAYNKEYCDRPDVKRELEQGLSRQIGQGVRIEFAVAPEAEAPRAEKRPAAVSRIQRMRDLEQNPFVQETMRLFEAEITRVDEPRDT